MVWKELLGKRKQLDRLALPLGIIGIIAVGLYNWRLWQKDKELLARLEKPEPLPPLEEWPELPTVSVLVAAWNEADFIERHIQSFLDLRYPNKELVLCAGGEDGTYEKAGRYTSEKANGEVIVLEQLPGEGKQRALARALPESVGEIIFLTDADCLLDNEAFERTLWLVASKDEEVCTGGSRPLPEQMNNPFVFTQAAGQLYSSYHSPTYADGLLGRNCAVERSLLERSKGLEAPALTGTDYVLSKVLLRAGTAIRQLPQSQVATRYPTKVEGYMRQQRRWLRNVATHGRRFGADAEMYASLRTSLVGMVMLLLPLVGILLAPWLLILWVALISQAFFARLRYLAFGGAVLNRPVRLEDVVWQDPLLFLDFAAWTQLLVDYLQPTKEGALVMHIALIAKPGHLDSGVGRSA